MKKVTALLLCFFLLSGMMVTVRADELDETECLENAETIVFQEECFAPIEFYPFVFSDDIAAETWERRLGHHSCEDGYLYVKNRDTGEIYRVLPEIIKEIRETYDYLYCISKTNFLVRSSYDGETVMILYETRYGELSNLQYSAGVLYFMDGSVLVRLDLRMNSFEDIGELENVESLDLYGSDKLMVQLDGGQFYSIDVQRQKVEYIGDHLAMNRATSVPVQNDSLIELYSTFAIPSNAPTMTLPLAEYPVGSYFSTSETGCDCHSNYYNPCPYVSNCTCINYADAIQCMGFAMYASDQYAHLTYLNTTGNWLDERDACADRRTYKYEDELITASDVREEFSSLGVGSYVRLLWLPSQTGHSFVIVEFLQNGVITYDSNVAGDCEISLQYRRYENLTSYDYILNTVTHHFEGRISPYSSTHHNVKCLDCNGYAHKTHYTTNAAGTTCDGCGYVGTIPVITP